MTAAELQAELGIGRRHLDGLVAAGLPFERRGRRRVFDPEAVRRWLVSTGRTEEPNTSTRDDAAQALGVHPRTLGTWRAQGCPGVTPGGYDLAAIRAWRNARAADPEDVLLQGPTSPALERYREARAQLAELDLDERRRRLIPQADVRQHVKALGEMLQRLGTQLRQDCGDHAERLLRDTLDEWLAKAESAFGETDDRPHL